MESEEEELGKLVGLEGLNSLTILNNMINEGDNIALKTDISNPKYLAILKTLSQVLKSFDYDLPASYIDFFIDILLIYRISYLRKSRTEVKEILCAQIASEKKKSENEIESQFK